MSDPKNYTVGWICAINTEYVAAQAFLEEKHEGPEYLSPHNKNDYTLGKIGKHNIVISVLPMGEYGTSSAARVAEDMMHSFPNIRIGLMVGIGGGAPSLNNDIRLGDIVVSIPYNSQSGVIQYDFGKTIQGQSFQLTGFLDQPPTVLRAAVNGLRAQYEIDGHQLEESVNEALKRKPRLRKRYMRPDIKSDRLYRSHIIHPSENESACTVDCGDDPTRLVLRNPRSQDEDNPAIHYGLIASANQLMKDALIRDKLVAEKGVLCFEMEAAGLMNHFPCLVIRGICDYSDSHKSKEWQGYAAMVAAAYAKDLLYRIIPQQVEGEGRILDILGPRFAHVVETTDRIDQNLSFDRIPIAQGAEFDSFIDQHENECLPGTRSDILLQIREWAFSPQGKCIFWLNGMAGTGKSTISRTVAKSFSQDKSLGASFFFKRGEGDRGNAMKLFPTVARQIVLCIPQLVAGVQKALHDDPNIALKGMKEQFDKLLLQPLQCLEESDRPIRTVLIVIDALDECDEDKDIRLILQLLSRLHTLKAVRLRVFLTSRPEIPIRLGFKKLANHDYKDLILHEVPKEVIEHDISLFLNHRLSEVRIDRDPPLPIDWPGHTNIQKLVALSIPLFIFAATMCRILEDPYWDPVDSLTKILTYQNHGSKLDGTYLPVLDRLLVGQNEEQKMQLVQEFHQVVGTIVILESPLSVTSLSKLLGCSRELVYLRLRPLHSLLSVPSDDTCPVQLFHLSFRDFLLDSETHKKTPLWVDEKGMHQKLAKRCLDVCRSLKRNICGLPSDSTERARINRQTIDRCLPPELQYACRYWASHLVQGINLNDMTHNALLFLQRHFLHWVEAMSLLGLVSEVVGILDLLQAAVSGDHKIAICDFLHDAKRFVLKFRQIADDAPLQLYCSGLVFAPSMAIIRREFKDELPRWINQLPKVDEKWSTELQTLEGHSGGVYSVAFSPDSQLLASGSFDDTVRLWNPATGALYLTLEGHLDIVSSVAFSPDGRLLASGSEDNTVRLWDLATGVLHLTLKGHSKTVSSVAFSPDGQLLASGSEDNTIRLWHPLTGAKNKILRGHTDTVHSVAFSPNGQLLASGYDNTVRLWDPATGTLHQTLEAHSDTILSVTFSPDGQLLASGSEDNTIRLWHPLTGAKNKILRGHTDTVHSVAFSPNGQLLASGSYDNSIRLWDPATGTLHQTLEAHSDTILSVTFSPDGQLLASGSDDQTIRLWDPAITMLYRTLEEHLGPVCSLKFSPDGQLLASGSDDHLLRLWDLATGTLQQTLKGHSGSVSSISFSPNGRLLATGSKDNTIRLWDPVTGALYLTLQGHLDAVWSVSFSSDGQLLASGSEDGTVRLWDPVSGMLHLTLQGHSETVHSVAFSPDGQLLASGSKDGTMRLWNPSTGELHHTIQGHLDTVFSVVFSPDGQLLASGSNDNTVRLWDPVTGAMRKNLEGHSGAVSSVVFSPDGRLLATGSNDNTVRLWDRATGALHQILEGHSDLVSTVALSPDGRLLASGSVDKTVRLWDPRALHQSLNIHSGPVSSVAFSPNGQLLASGSHDNTVRLWDPATGELHLTLDRYSNLEGYLGEISSVSFSPNGQLLASGSTDNTVRLWDPATGALYLTLEGHSSMLYSVVFSPNGRLLASCSHDQTVRLWDPATGALHLTLEGHSHAVFSVAFSPDGQLLASGSGDNTIRLWDPATGALYVTLEGHSDTVSSVVFSPDGRLLVSGSWDKTVRLWDPATGKLHQTWSVDALTTTLEFSHGNIYLRINLGSLVIQRCDSYTPGSPFVNLEMYGEPMQWITSKGKNLLWLPAESRPRCSAIHSGILAIGHESGHVSFIGFRV